MTRYVPSPHYRDAGLAAAVFGLFSAWCGLRWVPAWAASGLFLLSAAVLFFLALRPAIELHPDCLRVGRRRIAWPEIRRVDHSGSLAVLIVHLTTEGNRRLTLIYPGDAESAAGLLSGLRRSAREALIDGRPYREYWREAGATSRQAPRYRLLRPEDEEEVERMSQRLKSVRHLDPDNSGDEK